MNSLIIIKDEIHIWNAELSLSAAELARLWQYLSMDEKHRAERFKFDIHRNRFIATRGALREILGNYLNLSPAEISFGYGDHGKPYLTNSETQNITFNTSNSADLALYAFAKNRELGIDIEYMRDDLEPEALAERFFSTYECKILSALPASQKKQAFFNCWTRKEAVIKAFGKGLSFPLNEFDVTLAPDEPARLLTVHGDSDLAKRWSMYSLNPAENYAAALVAEGNKVPLKYFQWQTQAPK